MEMSMTKNGAREALIGFWGSIRFYEYNGGIFAQGEVKDDRWDDAKRGEEQWEGMKSKKRK